LTATRSMQHLLDAFPDYAFGAYKMRLNVEEYSDGELQPKPTEEIMGADIFLLASNSKGQIEELILTLDCLHRCGVRSIILILPYFGYSRQDRAGCTALGAKVMAKLVSGTDLGRKVSRVLVIDLHAIQEQGFFDVPCDNIAGHLIFKDWVKEEIGVGEDTVFCSPDAGGIKRVEFYTEYFDAPIVSIHKKRKEANQVESMFLIGDVTNKKVIIFDDMVDTCGTLVKAVQLLKDKGAREVHYIATHGVLSGPARENLERSGLTSIAVTDTIDIGEEFLELPFFNVVTCVNVLGNRIFEIMSSITRSDRLHTEDRGGLWGPR
jgi:ribose-phosphate pyrophosphokinase